MRNLGEWVVLVCLMGFARCQESVFIQTDAATTQIYSGGEETIAGTTMTFKDTTLIITAATSSQPAETITRDVDTRTFTDLPAVLATVQDINAVNDIQDYASTLTSLVPTQVAKAISDLESYYASLQPNTPYIIYQAPKDLMDEFVNDGLDQESYVNVFEAMMKPWDASGTSQIASLLTGNPSLSSEVLEYMSVAKTFLASSQSVVGSIVTQDLSLTGAAPAWASSISAATATATDTTSSGTSSSSGGAIPTAFPDVLLKMGAFAAEMAILAIL